MDAKEFNELLKLHYYDKSAKYKLCCFCLGIIKKRLIFRGVYNDSESISHSILEYFLNHIPKYYVGAPCKYLNKSTDNFLSNYKKKENRLCGLIEEVSYEQRFTQLEKSDVYRMLLEFCGELDANILFMHYVDGEKEYEIAKKVGLSYDAVRKRISRCKKELKIKFKRVTK